MYREHEWSGREARVKVPKNYKPIWKEGESDVQWYYQGASTEKWMGALGKLPECKDYQHLKYNSKVIQKLKKFGVVGSYALSNPYEFYADGYMSYFLTRLEDFLVRHKKIPPEDEPLWRLKTRKTFNSEWPCFFYWNIKGSKLWAEFNSATNLVGEDLEHFAKRYFKELY